MTELFLRWGPSIETTNAPPNDFVTLTNGALPRIRYLISVTFRPIHMTTVIPITHGTLMSWYRGRRHNNFIAIMAADAAKLKQIKGPIIFEPYGGSNYQGHWMDIKSGASEAQFKQLWMMTYNYFINTSGLSAKMLWSFEVCGGCGNYTWGFPGKAYVDIVGSHSFVGQSGTLNADSEYAALSSLSSANGGLPMINGSTGWHNFNDQAPDFSQNNYTGIAQVLQNKYPKYFGAIWWCQGDSLNHQNGAKEAMSAGGWKSAADVPKGIVLAKWSDLPRLVILSQKNCNAVFNQKVRTTFFSGGTDRNRTCNSCLGNSRYIHLTTAPPGRTCGAMYSRRTPIRKGLREAR